MTILFMDSFKWGDDSAWVRKWESLNYFWGSNVSRWPGEYAAYLSSNGRWAVKKVEEDTHTTLCVGFAYQNAVGGSPSVSTTYPFVSFRDKYGGYHCGLCFDVDGYIHAYRGATLLGTSSTGGHCTYGEWNHIQFKVYAHASAGTVDVIVNGVTVLTLTSQNTSSGETYIDQVLLRCFYNDITAYYDDFWITTGEFLGDCRVRHVHPDAVGNYSQFNKSGGTYNYEMIDDPDPDDDTTYVQSAIKGNKDSYGVTPLSGAIKIHGIQIQHMIKRTGSAGVGMKGLVRSGGADYLGAQEIEPTTGYKAFMDIRETDPQDSQPWTWTKLGNAEFGVELISATSTTTTTTTS